MLRGNTWKRICCGDIGRQRFLWQRQDNRCRIGAYHGKIPSIAVCIARWRLKGEPRYSQASYGVADLRCTLVDRLDR